MSRMGLFRWRATSTARRRNAAASLKALQILSKAMHDFDPCAGCTAQLGADRLVGHAFIQNLRHGYYAMASN